MPTKGVIDCEIWDKAVTSPQRVIANIAGVIREQSTHANELAYAANLLVIDKCLYLVSRVVREELTREFKCSP